VDETNTFLPKPPHFGTLFLPAFLKHRVYKPGGYAISHRNITQDHYDNFSAVNNEIASSIPAKLDVQKSVVELPP
jgi:hypothetical protein